MRGPRALIYFGGSAGGPEANGSRMLALHGARLGSPLAQTRVSVPCWPIRASSWNQISIGLSLARSGSCAVTVVAKFF
jgi:hypothetical protein